MSSTNPLRQKMINMMYLVLTALLALNVSADILKAFALVNKGLKGTNDNYEKKTQLTMDQFQKVYELDKKKAELLFTNAKSARQKANELYEFLDELKEKIAAASGGWTDLKDKKTVVNDQDMEVAQHFFVEEKNGEKLRNKLAQFEKEMLKLSNNEVVFDLGTKDPAKDKDGIHKTWSEYYFEGVPAVAAITVLTKMQNDIRNAEAEVTNYNFKRVGYRDIPFDTLEPVVNAVSNSVFLGDRLKAEIFLGARNSTQEPVIEVDGRPIDVSSGKGVLDLPASKVGDNNVKVAIKLRNKNTGKWTEYNKTYNYQVYKGAASVSADAMNMLYSNIDNPISISVPGFRPDQIVASASGAQLVQLNQEGKYKIKPPIGYRGKITISVAARTTEGTKPMGITEYRVRPIPLPEIIFGSKRNGGNISRGELLTINRVNSGLGVDFAFNGIPCKVVEYQILYVPKGKGQKTFTVSGDAISSDLRAYLQNAHTGDLIAFQGAKVSVNGEIKQVPGVTYNVQ